MLSERKKLVLKAIIEEYIESAEPVGSAAVARRMNTTLSTATIRNEMLDLVSLGFLEQPHTSAGRVPSHAGYRFYVNELMDMHRLTTREMTELNNALNLRIREFDLMTHEVGRAVSELMSYAALTIAPRVRGDTIHRLELIPYDGFTVIVVVVTNGGLVKNRVCRLNKPVTAAQVSELVSFFNRKFARMELYSAAPPEIMLEELPYGASLELVYEVLAFMEELINEAAQKDVAFDGGAKLLNYPEFKDVAKAQKMLNFMSDPKDLDLPPVGDQVKVVIGEENKSGELQSSSVVVTRYRLGARQGIIGVVGPTRMDYAKVIARLDYFANGLQRLLSELYMYDDEETE